MRPLDSTGRLAWHGRVRLPLLFLTFVLLCIAAPSRAADGPKNGTVLIIRHAEKPEDGPTLSPEGKKPLVINYLNMI